MTRKVKANQVKKGLKKVIILVGPSGSGKSTVAGILARRGWRLLKGDEIARGLYAPGKPAWRAIRRAFGAGLFSGGRVDRKKLGALVFSSSQALKRLNAILHPALNREIALRLQGAARACVDMAVYFAAGAKDFGAKVILVDAPLAQRVSRLRARGLDAGRARAQARSLKFGPHERSRCDAVLLNSGTRETLGRKLDGVLGEFF